MLTTIRKSLPHEAIVKKCAEGKCSARTNTKNIVILKGELIRKHNDEKAADCVFIAPKNGKIIVVIAELKSKTYRVKSVVKQIQATESRVKELLGNREAVYFRAVLAQGGHPNKSAAEFNILRKQHQVRPLKCGESIDGFLSMV